MVEHQERTLEITILIKYLIKTKDPEWSKYKSNSHPKIALKYPEHLLDAIYHKYKDMSQRVWCLDVEDEGRTQVPEGTRTALVFKPMRKVDAPDELEGLRLYQFLISEDQEF